MWCEHRKQLVKALLATLLLAPLMVYVFTYVTLRNRGLSECKQYDSAGFLYDRTDDVLRTHNMRTHEFRMWIFTPLNFVDRTLFNGPDPIRCLMFELS